VPFLLFIIILVMNFLNLVHSLQLICSELPLPAAEADQCMWHPMRHGSRN
jgi:hypothetical protein